MRKDKFRKGLVFGIILLLIGMCVIPSTGSSTTVDKSSKTITKAPMSAPLPPLMWTEDFTTLYIKIPGDPSGEIVYYCIDWGDGTQEELGPYNSDEIVTLLHMWNEGEYTIKIKAKNQYGEESKWATYRLILSSDFKLFHISIGYVEINYIFTIYWKDCVFFIIDWDDGSSTGWIGPYPDEIVIITHNWSCPGEYYIKLKGKDEHGNQSDWVTFIVWIINLENNPPGAPFIEGPTNIKSVSYYYIFKQKTINYTFRAIDPDDDNVSYYIDWGDGTYEGWTSWYASGEEVSISHTWTSQGSYTIRARAKDIHGLEGPEGTLWVCFFRSSQLPANSLFLWFLERFPFLQQLLNILEVLAV